MNKELSDISGKLEIYRNNLLNLSLRNNQISYNPKSTRRNQIRIIDEIPEIICEKILNGKKMSLEFLPPLPKTPPDEDTPKFKNAYQNALNIYENYESNEIEENEKGEIDNYILDFIKDKKEAEENNLETEEHEKIDRTLKDSIRVKLGLGPLEDSFPTESQWAKKNNIIPNYDLPLTKDIDSDEKKYNDTRIQTLFFQEEGQIKFDKLIAQNNNLINERGVNALWIAIGFLEYKIAKQADQFKYAPILFQEINIEKKDPINKGGKPVYNITNGGEVSLNKTFEKFLKKEFDISLPNSSHDKYKNEENFQIDQYLNDFEDAVSTQDNWRVRRFMNIGLFSFYEAEMYNDLDPERWSESHKPKDSKILKELLSTSEKSSDIDEGEIEIGDIDNENVVPEMPSLVYDANYSQISTIIRALDGNNIAVKGPPGTGKSQTITNLILAALERGKRVLFVAQKKAALDVVYRQIEKKGLDNFVLDLHDVKSNKQNVADSIFKRMDLTDIPSPRELNENIKSLRETAKYLNNYCYIIKDPICEMGFNFHEIIYKYHYTRTDSFPVGIPDFKDAKNLTLNRFNEISGYFEKYSNLLRKFINEYGSADKHPLSFAKKRLNPIQIQELEILFKELLIELELLEDMLKKLLNDYSLINLQDENLDSFFSLILETEEIILAETFEPALFKDFENQKIDKDLEGFIELISKIDDNSSYIYSKINRDEDEENSYKQIKDINIFVKSLNEYGLANENPINIEELTGYADEDFDKNKKNFEIITEVLNSITNLDNFNKEKISKLNFSNLNLFLDFIIPKLREIKPSIIEGCKSIDTDRLAFLHNKEAILSSIRSQLISYSKDVNELKKIRSSLENKINLDIEESVDELRQAGLYLMRINWFSFLAKSSEEYKIYKQIYSKYASNPEKIKDSEIGHILYKVSKYKERSEKIFTDDSLEDLLGRIWKKEDTNFNAIVDYIDFINEIDLIENKKLRELVYENILKLDGESLKGLSDKVTKIALSNSNFQESHELKILNTVYDNFFDYISGYKKFVDQIKPLKNILSKILLKDENYQLDFSYEDFEKIEEKFDDNFVLKKDLNNSDIVKKFKSKKIDESNLIGTIIIYKKVNELIKIKYSDNESFLSSLKECIFTEEIKSTIQNLKESLSNIATQKNNFASLERNIEDILNISFNETFNKNYKKIEWVKSILNNFEIDILNEFMSFKEHKNNIKLAGLEGFLNKYNEISKLDNIKKDFLHYVYRSIAKDYSEIRNFDLSEYTGESLNEARRKLEDIDIKIKDLNAKKIASFLVKNKITPGERGKKVSEHKNDYLLRYYYDQESKRFGNQPLKRIIQNAHSALLDYKPCWLMSPHSVAKYVPKHNDMFDLVIIDEASQMTAESSIGSLLRGKNAIIVGDEQQLPPTIFGKKQYVEDEELPDSILQQALLSFKPHGLFNEHYRSRHESLIRYSNKKFYKNKLHVFPSPMNLSEESSISELGLSYEYLKDATYEGGGTNSMEADIVVERIIEHMHNFADESLIAVAMSKTQAELIEQKYKERINTEDLVACRDFEEKWKSKDKLEPFEVKNLENVQGDQRDAIIISTVYGRNPETNIVRQNFGPINGKYGHRRLNVLFTRAKKRNHIVSCLQPNDIITNKKQQEGLKVFSGILEYAKTGRLETGEPSGKPPDSPFEESVREILESKGYKVENQVGVANYFIDLGVKHPNWPDGFLAGIECDGATYHSAKSARDRDFARQKVLEELGWNIHRVWSTDWFNNPKKTTDIMINQLEKWINKSH